jgi:hypothetical protein
MNHRSKTPPNLPAGDERVHTLEAQGTESATLTGSKLGCSHLMLQEKLEP